MFPLTLRAAQVGSFPGVPAEDGHLGAGGHAEHPVGHRGVRGRVWTRLRRGAEDPQRTVPPAPLFPPALWVSVRPHGQQ